MVAGDAARALGALGRRASLSVAALVKTLSHEDAYVRVYAAEALASIGPGAASATTALAEALGDPVPGVRWAACEALGSIGPPAQSAVPRLIEALDDEFLYVRIFAAGALGSIGPKAQSARAALKESANDPALRNEAEWALGRIAGVTPGEPVASHAAPAPVAPPLPTTVVDTGNPPVDWDTTTGRNIVWSVEAGKDTFGRPVVAGDAVYLGTDNARQMNPAYQEEAGVLMPRNVQKDPEASLTWHLKDELVQRANLYYAKLSRGKAMFIAPRMVPFFHAIWGVRRAEEKRRLGRQARAILRVLRHEWEMATSDLRSESGVKDRYAFARGMALPVRRSS